MDVEAGTPFEVEFAAAPTTGYLWEVASLPEGMKVLGSDFAIATGAAIGDPGTQRFRLRADRVGQFEVGFVLKRPWEADSIQTHAVAVEVREPAG